MCHELCAMSHMLYAISMSAQSHYQVVVRQSGAVIYGPDSALVRALQTVLATHKGRLVLKRRRAEGRAKLTV